MGVIIRDIEQGSLAWHRLRLGWPTASCFHRIITPAAGKASTQAVGYRRELLAEWLTGVPAGMETNGWMQRGTEMEAEARAYYAMAQDDDVEEVAFVWLDDRVQLGCSPDGLVGEDGGLEIKCPAPHTHVGYLLDRKLPTDYIPQVQGSMWVCDRQWWDFLSYHPNMEPLVIRVERDEKYIEKLAGLMDKFLAELLAERKELLSRGYAPKEVAA